MDAWGKKDAGCPFGNTYRQPIRFSEDRDKYKPDPPNMSLYELINTLFEQHGNKLPPEPNTPPKGEKK
jgi:hypothetical protein